MPRGTESTTGAKFRIAGDAGLRRGGRRPPGRRPPAWRSTPIVTRLVCDDLRAGRRGGAPRRRRSRVPTLAASTSTSARDGEAALAEPAVVGEGLAEVAGTDDDDRPVVGEARARGGSGRRGTRRRSRPRGCRSCRGSERSLRTLAAFTPASSASRSDEMLSTPSSASSRGCAGTPAAGRRWPRGSGGELRSTMRLPTLRPSCNVHKGIVVASLRFGLRWCSDRRAPSAAAATLVAVAFALSHARPLAAPPAPPRAGLDVSLAMFAVASGALWWAAATGLEPGHVPRLLPVRRGPERAVAGPRHRLPARRAPARRPRAPPVWRCSSAFSRRRRGRRPARRRRARPTACPTGSDVFGPLPRVLAAVGSGVAALVHHRRRALSAWRLWRGHRTRSPPACGARPARARQPADRRSARSSCRPAARSPAARRARGASRSRC